IKEYEGVAEAKEKLDGYYEHYAVLRDERDVKEFIQLANALSPVTSITLDSERAILDAENAYKEMSDAARAAKGVDEANEIVKAARARYDELFTEAEEKRIEAFIAAANEVGTDIENVNIKWYDVLHKASEAYSALTYKSQLRSDVKAAFDRWNQAQKAFDRKGYQQIPMKEPSIHYSGDNPPHLIMGTGMFDDVMAFYRVTSLDQLGQHAIMWLNIYQNDEVIARGEINMASDFFNNGSYLLMNYNVQRIIKSIAADNPKLVSGGTYAFSVNFEDKKGEFIPSPQSKVSAGHVYIW
ncbi:MAG: hypothetical protein K2K12_04440, partial [Clostridia bacterium]|nr:hypothetical protein [Clostridia bacterium]